MKGITRLGNSVLDRIIRESVSRVLNESGISDLAYGKRKDFLKKVNMGYFDERIYNDKESVKEFAGRFIDERLLDKVFKSIDNRYNMLCRQYPDGMPVLSDEERELINRGKRTIKSIEKGSFDYQIYYGGEKYISKIRRRYPNFPQVAEVAEKRLIWLNKIYKNGGSPHNYHLDTV